MGVGADLGKNAAQTVADAAEGVAKEAGTAAQSLGLDLADAVSIVAGSIDRAAKAGGDESAAWRVEVVAWRGEMKRLNDNIERLLKLGIVIGQPRS